MRRLVVEVVVVEGRFGRSRECRTEEEGVLGAVVVDMPVVEEVDVSGRR